MRRWLLRSLWVLLGLSILVPGGIWLLLRGSLPELDGELALPGLSAPVQVQRDGNGMVTVDAADERDMARALGYVHAQERFFEMDLMRRSAAGELSELFGANALPLDRRMRVHRLRTRAHDNLDIALGDRRAVLEAYRDGVNAGLAALPVRPWPYLLLRQRPRAWSLEDSVLAGLAMYADLQDPGNSRELALARIREVVPPALYALLAHDGSSWDAPLFGAARGDAPLPDAATLDLRQLAGRGGGDATAARLARTPAPLRDSGIGGMAARSWPTTCTWPCARPTSGSACACAIPMRPRRAARSTWPASACRGCRWSSSAAIPTSPGASPTATSTPPISRACRPPRRCASIARPLP